MIIELPFNPVPVYYAGGHQIRRYRSLDPVSEGPELSAEDWIGSTTVLESPVAESTTRAGISKLADGRSIPDLLESEPSTWLGSSTPRRESDFLLKLLDPGERIPVHWHPDRCFARAHLGLSHGKAEAWVILSETATVWLGWRPGTRRDEIVAAIERQDAEWMLGRMHRRVLSTDDTVFVPPGLVHAIGPGALLAEIQEPTSASILAEHERLRVGAHHATLCAGWDEALGCMKDPWNSVDIDDLTGQLPTEPGRHVVFPESSLEFFRCDVMNVVGEADTQVTSLSCVIVDRGTVSWCDPQSGRTTEGRAGSTWLLGASLGRWTIQGDARLLVFSGPSPSDSVRPEGTT